ncbi:hypothetical protein GALL_489040 [mine drainage metagenome]|uniref:Polysaccharide biosynthesis protein n=1 Tax=mine drainage metagenome TaxID=410659 RepID=A0A1J5PFD7_9ZZZZ
MENVVPVIAARRYGQTGMPGLLAYLRRITSFGSAMLIPVLLTLTIFATPITHLLYGDSYAASASLVIWQVGSIFLQFYLRQIFFFLRTVAATGAIIRAGAIMSITAVLMAMFTVRQYQEVGVMAALLAGTATGLMYSFAAALRITRSAQNIPAGESGQAIMVEMEIKS